MDTNNIADIVVSRVDLSVINQAIKDRAEALGSQMNNEAASQFVSDMSNIECFVKSTGDGLRFDTKLSDSYLLNYLKEHGTPVSGGDNGVVHNVDGSTYESSVPQNLQGTPLPWYELPHVDSMDEAKHIVELMATDAAQDAVRGSYSDIVEQVAIPLVKKNLNLGGG